MKHKTAELTGELLDAAVALADGRLLVDDEPRWPKGDYAKLRKEFGGAHVVRWYASSGPGDPATDEVGGWEPIANWGSPSTDWRLGGQIIERERMCVEYFVDEWEAGAACVYGHEGPECKFYGYGPTPLIAAMRAFVASKLGEEVELPG
jgi:hypothetical protein